MKALIFGTILASSLAFAANAYADDDHGDSHPQNAPLPALGLTLLGQLGAGALGWRVYKNRRSA